MCLVLLCRERLKLNAILLHEEKFLQLAAEQGGQTRKPVIPRETPEIKFKIRLRVTGVRHTQTPSNK